MGSPLYYPETVVFVLDACEDPGMEPARHATRFELLKQSIHMFAQAKSRVNSAHKYGLAVIRDTVEWEGAGVSASPEGLASALQGVQPHSAAAGAGAGAGSAAALHPPLDLGAVVALVHPLAVAEEADGARVRVILVYGRSTVVPVWTTQYRPGEALCMDVLFVHDKAAAAAAAEAAGAQDCAFPQDVFSWLEENVDVLSGRCGHNAYIFEAGSMFVKKVPNLMVSLVAHPTQRPPQRALRTAPLDLAAMPPQPTAATATTLPGPAPDASTFPPMPGSTQSPAAASPAGSWAAIPPLEAAPGPLLPVATHTPVPGHTPGPVQYSPPTAALPAPALAAAPVPLPAGVAPYPVAGTASPGMSPPPRQAPPPDLMDMVPPPQPPPYLQPPGIPPSMSSAVPSGAPPLPPQHQPSPVPYLPAGVAPAGAAVAAAGGPLVSVPAAAGVPLAHEYAPMPPPALLPAQAYAPVPAQAAAAGASTQWTGWPQPVAAGQQPAAAAAAAAAVPAGVPYSPPQAQYGSSVVGGPAAGSESPGWGLPPPPPAGGSPL